MKVAIITNILPAYRKGFYDRLFSSSDIHVEVFCQSHIPGSEFNTIHQNYPQNLHLVKFISAKKEKVVWQFIPWIKILKSFDVVFVMGNPRVVSDFLFGTFCRLIRKKVVLWTTAHSYRGNKITENIRLWWSRMFPAIFVYTDKEVSYLRNKGFVNQHIVGMNNGLDQQIIDQAIKTVLAANFHKWKEENGLQGKTTIISCARLEKKNQFDLVLKALLRVKGKYPNILWLLVGSGEQEEYLKRLTTELGLCKNVVFLGQIYEEEKLAPYFLSSSVFVHPAAIGLSLMHAYGYGLPVIVHGQEANHGPEYAAFRVGATGLNFEMKNTEDLADKICSLLDNQWMAKAMGQKAQEIARNEYNVDVMVERFVSIAKHSYANKTNDA